MTMRWIVIVANIAFASLTMADLQVHMEKVMGKAFMPAAAPPQRAGHMSVHPGAPVAPADRPPITKFSVSNPEKSFSNLRGEISKLRDTNDRMQAKLEALRPRIAIMEGPQAQAKAVGVQNWGSIIFGSVSFGYSVGATLLLSIIYTFSVKLSRRASATCTNHLDDAELQPSATQLPLLPSNSGLRRAGVAMSERKGSGGHDAMHDPEPTEASNRSGDVNMSMPASRASDVIMPTLPLAGPDSSIFVHVLLLIAPCRQSYGHDMRRGCRSGDVKMLTDGGEMKVIFLGTPDVAARSLELLLAGSREGRGGFEIVAVVSQPPAPKGRKYVLTPSPVQELAEAEGLPILTPPNAKGEEFLTTLAELEPDLCITAAYGCFLPQRFLDLPAYGTLNIHASLLPLFRGPAPIQRCLEAGDASTGVTVSFTVLAMDAGPVLRQVERPLSGDETAPDLLLELVETGTEQLLEALPSVWDGSCKHSLVEQDGTKATKAPKVQAAEAEVCLDVLSALTVHNRARAFAGWPGVWTMLSLGDGKPPVRAKLLSTAVGERSSSEEGGGDEDNEDAAGDSRAVSLVGKALQLQCSDGSVLLVKRLTVPGKKPCDAKAFWNGLNGRVVRWVGSDEAGTGKEAKEES